MTKIGNILTLIVALNLTKTDSISQQQKLVDVFLPEALGEKLYTAQVGSYSFLDNRKVNAWRTYGDSVALDYFIEKPSNTHLTVFTNSIDQLVIDTKYYSRYEVSFLLSDDIVN